MPENYVQTNDENVLNETLKTDNYTGIDSGGISILANQLVVSATRDLPSDGRTYDAVIDWPDDDWNNSQVGGAIIVYPDRSPLIVSAAHPFTEESTEVLGPIPGNGGRLVVGSDDTGLAPKIRLIDRATGGGQTYVDQRDAQQKAEKEKADKQTPGWLDGLEKITANMGKVAITVAVVYAVVTLGPALLATGKAVSKAVAK